MPIINIPCPDSVLISLKETPEQFAKEAIKLLAVKLYEMGKLSSGRAAELAGMSRIAFLQSLERYDAPIFDLSKEELSESIILDTTLTPELEAEGFAREISRKIQAMRKKEGLIKTDQINLEISGEISNKIESQKELIQQRTNAKEINITTSKEDTKFNHSEEGKIKENTFIIQFTKL